jgi:hypothetical protein
VASHFAIVRKPWDPDDLVDTVERMLAKAQSVRSTARVAE